MKKQEKEISKLQRWNKKYKIFMVTAILLALLTISLVIAIPLSI